MPQSYPSIQSFYKREIDTEKTRSSAVEQESYRDGFTEQEAKMDPSSRNWNPEREYEEITIEKLVAGPNFVTFAGRVVNFTTINGSSSIEKKAAGWHYLLVKDNTAAISIKLYFTPKAYPIKLGQMVTIWTGFISGPSKHEPSNIQGIIVYGNLFPGRVTSDHIIIHTSDSTSSICRIPLDYRVSQPLPGLMTLSSYLAGGHDGVNGAKILVCVKSIGPLKKILNKTGGSSELIEVLLFDHTGEVRFTAWNEMTESAKDWTPGVTILLVSNPGYRVAHNGKGTVGMVRQSMVDVDPEFPDGEWLRKFATSLTKRESMSLAFPEGVWDVEAAEYGVNRIFFTLAELDRWVRADGNMVFTGFINVMILEINLCTLNRRNMLMCGECCGIPTFSNTSPTPCTHCTSPVNLHLNPKIIGTLLDETGCIASGKLLWSDRAWELLFGRSVAEISKMSMEDCRLLDMRCFGMRVHLVVGWKGEGEEGRLGVLSVMV